MNEQSNETIAIQADETSGDENSSGELTALTAESLSWVAGGPNGTIIVQS